MPGITESVWHNTASMAMCVRGAMETTRGPHAQLKKGTRGDQVMGREAFLQEESLTVLDRSTAACCLLRRMIDLGVVR